MTKTPAESFYERFLRPYAFWLAAGSAGALAWQIISRVTYPAQTFALYADRGESIFHAILDKGASYSLPFFSLLTSLAGYHGSGGTDLLIKIALLGVYALAYALGSADGRRARGLVFVFPLLIMDRAGAGMEAEQIVYTFLLLLYLNLENRRLLRPGLIASAVSGLGLGLTLLVRSPLFAFPPIAALWGSAGGKDLKKRLPRAALFLAAAYILLVPWIGVNRTLFGRFIPFEQERSSCNIITAVKGSVFTMEGDCRELAGLSRTDSVYAWALKEVSAHPAAYTAGVFKRLWQVFLMFPVLLPLALIGLALAWKKENTLLAALTGYFILIHCLFSIEERYFYPLRYLLAILAAAGVFEAFSGRAAPRERASAVPLYAVFSALMLFALAAEYRLLVYPARAANPFIAVGRELARYPGDPWLLKKKGFLLLGFNRTGEGLELLERAFTASGGKEAALGYITRTVNSALRPESPPAGDNFYELNLVKLLKELELGRLDAAAGTINTITGYWAAEKNLLKGVPHEKDREILRQIQRSAFTWADYDLYQAMYFWPVEKRAKIITALGRFTPITPRLEFLRAESLRPRAARRQPATAGEDAWSPGAELNYNATALELAKAVLGKIAPVAELSFARGELHPGGGLPHPLPLILSAAAPALRNGDPAALAANLGRNADHGELGALIDLYGNAPDSAAFLNASRRLLTLRPDDLAALLIRLSAVRSAGDAGEVLSVLKKDPRPAIEAAGLAAGQGRTGDALELCGWALAGGTADAATGQAAALLYQRLGAYDRALPLLSDAIKKRPGEASLYNDRGVILRFLKRDEAAKEDFIKALRLSPADISASLNLAGLYAAQGNKPEAIALYTKLLGLPGLPPELSAAARDEISKLQ